jgi:hypothetical protein
MICSNNYEDFDPKAQYGRIYETTDNVDAGFLQFIMDEMYEEIEGMIPPPYRGRIKWAVYQPGEVLNGKKLALGVVMWKYLGE